MIGRQGELPECGEDMHKKSISSKRLNEVNIKHSFSPDDVVLASSASTYRITEASGPPSPREGLIPNFGAIDIDRGIYRSSFPHSCNLEHLKSLKLKTIVTLVPTTFESDVQDWLASSAIQHFRIKIAAHKSSEDAIPIEDIVRVMKLMTDETKRPILIHCNKGKHRTGCMTACFRKLHGLDDVSVITEYHEYARPKARGYDVAFISRLQIKEISTAVSNLKNSIEPICHPQLHRTRVHLRETGSAEKEQAELANREGQSTTEESKGLDIPGRQTTAPTLPFSPPFSPPTDPGFCARDLTAALWNIEDGRDRAALTPPQTPSDAYGSESSGSVDEYS